MKGELTQRKRARPTVGPGGGGGGGGEAVAGGDKAAVKRMSSSAEHMKQMAAASTEALQRPRKERDRFRRFIVDVVTQAECVPGGRKKVRAAEAATGEAPMPEADVPSASGAPLTTGEKDLLRCAWSRRYWHLT